MSNPTVKKEFDELRTKYPWPIQRPNVDPAEWNVDGGGRELVTDKISRNEDFIIIEIGVFLGSSVKKWLNIAPKVHVIAIDPWKGDWWADYAKNSGRLELVEPFSTEDGLYLTFLSSLWEYKERVFPVRGYSPDKLYELFELGVRPDLIYIDSDKSGNDIEVAHKLFPSAILTGDDWTWGKGFPIRKAVRKFAKTHGYFIRSHNATWIVDQNKYTLKDYINKGVEAIKDQILILKFAIKRRMKG